MPKNKAYLVGITGGIGAGKSIVAKVFHTLCIPVYDADSNAKWLMNSDPVLQNKIVALFGDLAYQDGSLNRRHIAQVVFKNKALLTKLNAVVHPAVAKDFENWARQQSAPYVLKEAALLFETGSYKQLDKTICVTAPKNIRISRVVTRDNRTIEDVEDIISKQWSEEEKVKLADFLINNDEQEMIIPQVLETHQAILAEIKG